MKFFHTSRLILLLLPLLVAPACNSIKKTTADKSEIYTPSEKSLLWEISGNGLKKPSYLFGTIHLIGKDDFFFPQTLEDKLNSSEQVTFEIDMDEMTSMESMMKIIGKAFMKDGISLRDLINDEDYALVEKKFNEKGLPLQFLEKMKPMLLSTFASFDMEGGGMNASSKSYEMEIYSKSQASSKESKGLETIEDQLAIFDTIPYKMQAQMLVESIKSSDQDNKEYKEMIDLYKKQDIELLSKVAVQDEGDGMGKYEDLFLYNRNKNWIPKMSTMMKEKSTFFAVGAGHLGGKKGVISLLKKAGYKVTAVKMGLGA